MKKKTLKITSLALLIFFFMGFTPGERISPLKVNQEAIASPCHVENNSFKPGESITYKLYYNWNFVWLSAGEVTFKVKDKGRQYHLSARGQTYKSYEWFYKVREKYDSYINKKTLLPELSIRDVLEGEYTMYDKIKFDQYHHKAYSTRGKTKAVATLTEYDIESCMHDILSVVYYTRNLDYNKMSKGSTFPVKIFMDKETWPLKVRYLGKEKNKKIKGLGKFNTIKFSPEVILGEIFTEQSQMYVWATDDKNKIPLLIESPVSVGSVKAILKEYKGLRYDLDSAIQLY